MERAIGILDVVLSVLRGVFFGATLVIIGMLIIYSLSFADVAAYIIIALVALCIYFFLLTVQVKLLYTNLMAKIMGIYSNDALQDLMDLIDKMDKLEGEDNGQSNRLH